MSNFFAIPITDEWGTTYQPDHCNLYRTGCPHAGAFAAGLLYRQFCEAAYIFRVSWHFPQWR